MGSVLTAAHVVLQGRTPTVSNVPYKISHYTPFDDTVVLVPSGGSRRSIPIPLADERARIGQAAYAIGYPSTLVDHDIKLLTAGVISGRTVLYGWGDSSPSLILDMHSAPGGSGGPILNSAGQVIGVLKSGGGVVSQDWGLNEPIWDAFVAATELAGVSLSTLLLGR